LCLPQVPVGCTLMADKGFAFREILLRHGVELLTPPRRHADAGLTADQMERTGRIASARCV